MHSRDSLPPNDRRKTRHRLNSWKEIASHLGRAVRTVQRWERDLGLPIHRLEGGKRDIVYAFVEEIDVWLAANSHRLEANVVQKDEVGNGQAKADIVSNSSDSSDHRASAAGEPSADPPGPLAATEPPEHVPATIAEVVELAPQAETRAGTRTRFSIKGKLEAGIVSIAALLLAIAFIPGFMHKRQPHSYNVDGSVLTILDDSGKTLWKKTLEERLQNNVYTRPDFPKSVLEFADLDKDGEKEVVIATWTDTFPGKEILCFESTGELRFRHRLEEQVKFGDKVYGPPHLTGQFVLTENEDGTKSIWTITRHNLMFPSAVQKLDAKGKVLGTYWSNGHINHIVDAQLNGRRVMLVGAMDNDTVGASLAVLDYEHPSGRAPAMKDQYRCANCPGGPPLYFLKFPRMELADLSGMRPTVPTLRVWPEGKIVLDVLQGRFFLEGVNEALAGTSIYTLDSDLRVIQAETDDAYRRTHQILKTRGLIKHTYGARDEAQLFPVLVWQNNEFVSVLGPGQKPTPAPSKRQLSELARIPRIRR